jgi:hypothetical protein
LSSSRVRRRRTTSLGGSGTLTRAGSLLGVLASGKERGQNGVVVANDNGIVSTELVLIPVSLVALVVVTRGRVVAVNSLSDSISIVHVMTNGQAQTYDILDHSIVVAVLHVRTVPVDLTSSPLNGTLSITSLTSGPQTELDSGWGLRVVVLAGGRIVSLVTI